MGFVSCLTVVQMALFLELIGLTYVVDPQTHAITFEVEGGSVEWVFLGQMYCTTGVGVDL